MSSVVTLPKRSRLQKERREIHASKQWRKIWQEAKEEYSKAVEELAAFDADIRDKYKSSV